MSGRTARWATITTRASTAWPSTCSTAAASESWVISARATRVRLYPAAREAASMPSIVLAGPKWLMSAVITPMEPERLVARVRAAVLRR